MSNKRRTIRKGYIILTAVICFMFLFPSVIPSSTNAYTVEAATKVKLSNSKTTLAKGQTLQLSITGTSKKVSWSSEDKSIATITSKGKIKAKAVGSTRVVAKVSGKKYYCKVTVKKTGEFDSTIAKQSISYTLEPVWNGVIATFKNNSGFPVYVYSTITFYDASGNQVATTNDLNPYFETGQSSVLFFEIPYGKTFSTYKLSNKLTKPSIKKGNAAKVTLASTRYTTGILVTAKNTSKLKTTTTKISMIYYKDGKAIYCEHDYAACKEPNSSADVAFLNPVDQEYDDVTFDDYKMFVDYSY